MRRLFNLAGRPDHDRDQDVHQLLVGPHPIIRMRAYALLAVLMAALLAPGSACAFSAGLGASAMGGVVGPDSTQANFIASASSLTCSSSPGKLINDSTADTLAWCSSGGSTVKEAALGNDSGQALAVNALSCNNGVVTDGSGVVSCSAPATSTPNFIGNWYTVDTGGGSFAIGTAMVLSSTTGKALPSSTLGDLNIIGCAQQASTGDGSIVFVATAGEANCIVDAGSNTNEINASFSAAGHFNAYGIVRYKRYGRIIDASTSPAKVFLYPGGITAATTYYTATYNTSTQGTSELFVPISGLMTTGNATRSQVEMLTSVGWMGGVYCQAQANPGANMTVDIYKNGSLSKTGTLTSGNTTAVTLGDGLDVSVAFGNKLALSFTYASGTYTGTIVCIVPVTVQY